MCQDPGRLETEPTIQTPTRQHSHKNMPIAIDNRQSTATYLENLSLTRGDLRAFHFSPEIFQTKLLYTGETLSAH